jgi:three-Cys-motif partner protein
MLDHLFGGDWTEAKLGCLRAYLEQYRAIFTVNARAKYFTTWYVDAFAGTGSRTIINQRSGETDLDETDLDSEASAYRVGSAMIALDVKSPFDKYLFIEKSKAKCEQLKVEIAERYSSLLPRCEFRVDDANVAISDWCKQRDWKKDRAVVFLDPFGMQVNWEIVKLLGSTEGIDLWYLFPFIARLLKHDGKIEETWRSRLDALFGTNDWYSEFYKKAIRTDLFGDYEVTERDATAANIQRYIENRLKSCFVAVAPSLVLRNSKQSPLFALCFAASNKKGAPIALRIASSILKEC